MSDFMNLPSSLLEKLQKEEQVLIKGGNVTVDISAVNNDSGTCDGVNNGDGLCYGGVNNGLGVCKDKVPVV